MQLPLNSIQKDELIKLYSENSISEIDNQPALITLIFAGINGINSVSDIEKSIPEYKEFMIHLRTIKNNIENIIKLDKIEAQARYCLIQLTNLVAMDDDTQTDIFNKLLDQMLLKNRWNASPELIKKYKEISIIIQNWNHFFVSYTTRDTPAVNNLYEPELFQQFTPEIIKKEITGNNLIAKYIVKCFKKYNSLKVFFDRDSIVCGDIIKDQVYEYCEKTFAFVQLIEDISFNKENGVINWCYNEYTQFKNTSGDQKSKHFFCIDGFDINLSTVPPAYYSWAKDIVETKYEKIYKPFDVTVIKKKCQDFTAMILNKRLDYINSMIKTVV